MFSISLFLLLHVVSDDDRPREGNLQFFSFIDRLDNRGLRYYYPVVLSNDRTPVLRASKARPRPKLLISLM